MKAPIVSVVMPVYNGEKYLLEAISSILNQTFTNFEFLIIDDGSTDNTPDIIKKYANSDHRIRVIQNKKNIGVASSLNIGLAHSESSLIARMDADDIAYPERLKRQYEFMQSHPDVSVCGSALRLYEQPKCIWHPPSTHDEINTTLLFECCLYHPTIIFRKEIVFGQHGGYQSQFSGAEDFELWQRLSECTGIKFANISEPLLCYRTHQSVDRKVYKTKQQGLANLVRRKQLKRLGLEPSNGEFILHETLSNPQKYSFRLHNLKNFRDWLDRLVESNENHQVFSPIYLKNELKGRWLNLCLHVAYESPNATLEYLKGRHSSNPLENAYQLSRMIWHSRKHWKIRNA
ncbi:MAG: glycosyltransferase family 2 protein [Methylococcaceae bacterium]